MTDMTGIPGFTYAGQHSNDLGIYLEQKQIEALPESRDYEQQIFGRPGQYDFESQHDRRMIAMTLTMLSDKSRQDLIDSIRRFAALIDPTKGYQPLIFDDEPDKYYLAKFTSNGSGASSPFVTYEQWMGHVQVGFKCDDPFAYAVVPQTPSFQAQPNQEISVMNYGTYETPVTLKITADSAVSNFEIDINGSPVIFNSTVNPGDELAIDTGEMTYTLNGDNAIQYWQGDFPTLKPGANTIVTNFAMNLALTYRERWL